MPDAVASFGADAVELQRAAVFRRVPSEFAREPTRHNVAPTLHAVIRIPPIGRIPTAVNRDGYGRDSNPISQLATEREC
jgi:hypothetical protein